MSLLIPVIAAAARSPLARVGGALRWMRPEEIAGRLARQLLEHGLPVGMAVDEVVCGGVFHESAPVLSAAGAAARIAGLPGGLPVLGINRMGLSSFEALVWAHGRIALGESACVLAGGAESLSRARPAGPHPRITAVEPDIYLPPFLRAAPGGENPSEEALTRYGETSLSRARAQAGVAPSCVLPLEAAERVARPGGFEEKPWRCAADENLEGGARRVAPGADGAAWLLLMEGEKAAAAGLKPLGRLCGSHRRAGPGAAASAAREVLKQANLELAEVALFQVGELTAASALGIIRALGLEEDRVNPGGGCLAWGFCPGAAGAVLAAELLFALRRQRKRWGLAILEAENGEAGAALFEAFAG